MASQMVRTAGDFIIPKELFIEILHFYTFESFEQFLNSSEQAIDFREPKVGDVVWCRTGGILKVKNSEYVGMGKYLILRSKKQIKIPVAVLRKTDEIHQGVISPHEILMSADGKLHTSKCLTYPEHSVLYKVTSTLTWETIDVFDTPTD